MGKAEKVKKTRATKACDQCSRYRRKCNMDTPCDLCAEKGRDCTYTKISRKRGPEPSRKSSKGQPPKIDPVPETLVKLTLDTSPQPARILKTFQIDPLSLSIPENQAVFPEFFSSPSASPTILPVAHWDASVFLSTIVIDCNGNSGSILDLYFAFPHQHLPMFSKQWFTQNIQDVPTHVLRAIYILVLVNASQSPESLLIAKLHAEHLRFLITNQEEVIDPFTVSSILNLAMFDNYNHDYQKSNSLLGLAIKAAKILGLHLDPDLKWPSTASGRILGGELGMGRQFLRSLWFLMYHWDHHNSVLYKTPLLIDNLISQEAIDSYFQPNVGDQSNVPLNFLSHTKYTIPLISIGKLIFKVKLNRERIDLLNKLNALQIQMPKPFVPREDVYVGRTISWINELLNYSKFRLLVPLHLDLDYEPFDKDYVRNQLKASVNAMHTLALGFVTYSTYQFSADHSFLFFSKTLFVAALVHCLLGNAKIEVLDVFVKAIKFSGYPQDYALLEEAGTNQGKAIDALLALLMF